MDKNTFTDLLSKRIIFDKYLNDLSKLNVNIYESREMEFADIIFDNILYLLFDENGVDLVIWWLYESDEQILKTENQEIDLSDINDFVDYLFDNYLKNDN